MESIETRGKKANAKGAWPYLIFFLMSALVLIGCNEIVEEDIINVNGTSLPRKESEPSVNDACILITILVDSTGCQCLCKEADVKVVSIPFLEWLGAQYKAKVDRGLKEVVAEITLPTALTFAQRSAVISMIAPIVRNEVRTTTICNKVNYKTKLRICREMQDRFKTLNAFVSAVEQEMKQVGLSNSAVEFDFGAASCENGSITCSGKDQLFEMLSETWRLHGNNVPMYVTWEFLGAKYCELMEAAGAEWN